MFQAPYPPYDPTDTSGWVNPCARHEKTDGRDHPDSRESPFARAPRGLRLTGCPSRYDTVVKRWPIILTNIIDHVHRLLHDMTLETQQIRDSDVSKAEELSKKITEGQEIISEISRLKYRMARDHELEWVEHDCRLSSTHPRSFNILIMTQKHTSGWGHSGRGI